MSLMEETLRSASKNVIANPQLAHGIGNISTPDSVILIQSRLNKDLIVQKNILASVLWLQICLRIQKTNEWNRRQGIVLSEVCT